MATPSPHIVLIPGAGSDQAYWDALRAELTTRGCSSTAVDLACTDEQALLEDYANAVVDAVQRDPTAQGRPFHLLAHSFGAFTAGLVPELLPVQHLTLISPMIPIPGESGSDWWGATGQQAAHQEAATSAGLSLPLGMDDLFYNDFTSDQRRAAAAWDRDQAEAAFTQPWPGTAWPSTPTTVLAFADDRLFPPTFVARLATERVGSLAGPVQQVPGGHMGMVSHPAELADAVID
ncbi:alpha/beta hydrolase [Ruania alba]|uniref:Pimeloyl-ACP methyl ester carboxylesterase n=1 Tax=Ruania alba TaxID=648782 RepID=A0A1H5HXB5_9MICO|nr:alpha/beta hydrolase [Ruania alba]SEE31878.1 Pimeloyl-ACP methyl ester carboxylesterase [Ruania alba]